MPLEASSSRLVGVKVARTGVQVPVNVSYWRFKKNKKIPAISSLISMLLNIHYGFT